MTRNARVRDALSWRDDEERRQLERYKKSLPKVETPSIFDAGTAPTQDQQIASVAQHAGPAWRDQALEAIRKAADANEWITSDEIDPHLPQGDPTDKRALGSVIRHAASLGWISSTGNYRTSARPETHRRPLRIWRSHLYRDGA